MSTKKYHTVIHQFSNLTNLLTDVHGVNVSPPTVKAALTATSVLIIHVEMAVNASIEIRLNGTPVCAPPDSRATIVN